MATWFTSDWHINGQTLIEKGLRPFSSAQAMNEFILKNANYYAKSPTDIIVHIGDLCQINKDNGIKPITQMSQLQIFDALNAQLICLEGNHDPNNRVKTVAKSLRTSLGKTFSSVVCCHYPSTDSRSDGHYTQYDIIIHGHNHHGIMNKKEIFNFDLVHNVLNVNVACDLWNFRPVSEFDLITAINRYLHKHRS